MRAFTASQSDSDTMSDKVAMEAEDEHDLGAAAPAEKGHNKYLEEQKHKREKAKARAKDKEEKRKRSEEKVAQEISEETEEEVDLSRYKSLSDMTPEDFHNIMMQQSRDIKELNRDRHRQGETNAAFSKVITAQSAAQKKSEETSVLYNYELTGLPGDDSEEFKRQFVMWCTEEAGIPKQKKQISGDYRSEREKGLLECSMAGSQRTRRRGETKERRRGIPQLPLSEYQRQSRPPPIDSVHF